MSTIPPRPFLIALAGPTSSGKTTIANALSLIFSPSSSTTSSAPSNNPFVTIHADDFYLPDSQIPTLANGIQDWDCAESLDVSKFRSVLHTIRDGGDVPQDLVRQGGLEDGERAGRSGAKEVVTLEGKTTAEIAKELDGVHDVKNSPISAEQIAALRYKISGWPEEAKKRRIVLVEGILLFSPQAPLSALTELYDLKILLRSTRAAAKTRREARNGYVTLEGFWQDPPGYFDEVVWPGFMKAYGGLFVGGDVEGSLDEEQIDRIGVKMGPLLGDAIRYEGEEKNGEELQAVLDWIIEIIAEEMTGHSGVKRRE